MEIEVQLTAQYDQLTQQIAAFSGEMAKARQQTAGFEQKLSDLEDQNAALRVAIEARAKADEEAAKRGKRSKQTDEERAAALKMLADQAELTASRMNATGRSQELLIKIGGQYASILRETGSANSDLMQAWRAGLSPAENSARKLVELAAASDDARLKTEAYQLATGELSDRMADQIRRQDTNVGSQNKLSRSLSELIDELKAAQKGSLAVAVAQAQQAETSAHVALELRKLAFETSDADKETAQYKTTVGALQKRMESLTIQEQANKLATEQTAEAYGQSKQRLDALETAMSALGIPGADLVQRGKQIADSLETMSEKGKKGETQLLKIAIAGGVTVASIAAVSAGFAAATANAAEWDDELAKVGLNVDKLSHQKLKDNAASLEAVMVSGKALGVSLAQDVGGAVAYVADGFTILNLALRDGWSKDLPAYGAETEKLNRRLADQVDLQERLKQQRQEQADQLGVVLDQQKREYELSQSLQKQIQDEQISRLTGEAKILAERDKRLKSIRDEFNETFKYAAAGAEAVQNYERLKSEIVKSAEDQIRAERKASADEQLKTISVMQQRYDGTETAVGNVDDAYRALAQAIVAADQADSRFFQGGIEGAQDYTSQIEQTTAALDGMAAAESARAAELGRAYANAASSLASTAGQAFDLWGARSTAAAEQSAKQIEAVQVQLANATTDSERKQLQARLNSLKAQEKANEKAAVQAFRLQQASAVIGIGISTAQAVMQALGSLPPPASYIAAGAAGVAGAVQAGVVLSQPAPSYGGASFSTQGVTAPNYGGPGSTAGSTPAPTLAAQRGGAEVTNANVTRADSSSVVPVTDAHYTATAGRRVLELTPGDEATVTRSGKMGSSAGSDLVVEEIKGLRSDINRMIDRMGLLHREIFNRGARVRG